MIKTSSKFQAPSSKDKGFTLIELLIYTGLSVIVGGLTVGTLLTITRVNQTQSATAEVSGQMSFVLQRIQQLVSESSNIEIDAGITTTTVKLRMQDSDYDPTCIYLSNGVIKLAQGPGSPDPEDCNSITSDLTSSKVVVNTFNLKKLVQYPGHDTLSVDMTMTYNSSSSASQVSRSLSSAIGRVSAATFDANVIPGSSLTYTLGQSSAPWAQVFLANGSAADPSLTFSTSTNMGLFSPATGILGFATGGNEVMRINSSGYVGIGTTTLREVFNVQGAYNNRGQIRIDSTTGTVGLSLNQAGLYKGWFVYGNAAPTAMEIQNYSAAAGGPLLLNPQYGGNVGIGTTTPTTAKLVVNGTVAASAPVNDGDLTTKAWVTANAGGGTTWQGYTTTTYTGSRGGTAGVNSICDANYDGSHICTFDELVKLGTSYPWTSAAWIMDSPITYGGVSAWCTGDSGACGTNSTIWFNCAGWNSAAGSVMGSYTTTDSKILSQGACDSARYFACCK